MLLEKENTLFRQGRTLDFKNNQLDKAKKRLTRKEGIFDSLCISIQQNKDDTLNILSLLKSVRTPFQAQDMVDTIVSMHAHDKFHNSNKDLVGLMRSGGKKKSQDQITNDDEVVINEEGPGKSKFGPDGKTGDETSSSSQSKMKAMPTRLTLDRAKLNSLITAMNRNNADDSGGDGEGCVKIRNFFLADIRHET